MLVLDDDMLPGSRYLQQLLHVVHSARHRALLGSIGWLLPRPSKELRFGSYRSLVNDSGGLYVPDLAYDISVERLLEADYLCSLWFGETRWLRLLWREAPSTFATGEDFHLSHMLRKHAGLPSYVMPVRFDERATWGDTEHALAYSRYSTGGRLTIELRDSLWWRALQGGSPLHWVRERAEPAAAVLVLVDGAAHASQLAPLLLRLRTSAPVAPLVALSGGAGRECASVAPLLQLRPEACDERRLRLFDMRLGREQPRSPGEADASLAPPLGAAAAAPRPPDASAVPSATSVPRVGAGASRPDGGATAAAAAAAAAAGLRASRAQAEAVRELGGMADASRASLLLFVADPASAASRAAAQLARLRPGLAALPLPRDHPPTALAWLGSLPLPALLRWREAALSLCVLAWGAAGGLARLRASLHQAYLLADKARPLSRRRRRRRCRRPAAHPPPPRHLPQPSPACPAPPRPVGVVLLGWRVHSQRWTRSHPATQVRLSVDLQPDATTDTAAQAQDWAWPHGRKQLRLRTATATPPASATAAVAERDRVVAAAEAWLPSGEAEAMVLLDDDVEVSPAFYLVLKRFLLITRAEEV